MSSGCFCPGKRYHASLWKSLKGTFHYYSTANQKRNDWIIKLIFSCTGWNNSSCFFPLFLSSSSCPLCPSVSLASPFPLNCPSVLSPHHSPQGPIVCVSVSGFLFNLKTANSGFDCPRQDRNRWVSEICQWVDKISVYVFSSLPQTSSLAMWVSFAFDTRALYSSLVVCLDPHWYSQALSPSLGRLTRRPLENCCEKAAVGRPAWLEGLAFWSPWALCVLAVLGGAALCMNCCVRACTCTLPAAEEMLMDSSTYLKCSWVAMLTADDKGCWFRLRVSQLSERLKKKSRGLAGEGKSLAQERRTSEGSHGSVP